MQTIEFEAELNEGMIRLPRAYRHWHEGQKVKIIAFSEDENKENIIDNKFTLSCLEMIQSDVGIVNGPDDLSSNPDIFNMSLIFPE